MQKTLYIIASLLFLLSSVACFGADKTGSVTVMSYNIRQSSISEGTNSWDYRYPASAMMINDHKPDVIGIQDALFEQMRYLEDVLKTYKYVGVGGEDGKKGGVYAPVLYNTKTVSVVKSGTLWLSDTPDKPSKSWESEEYLTMTWASFKEKSSGKKFLLVNTKLDKDSEEARAKALDFVIEQISKLNTDNSPVVLTGDLKTRPEAPELASLKSKLKDSRTIAFGSDRKGTYNNWGKQKDDCIFDYIWVSGFGSCPSFETITKEYYDRVFISDHFPIKAVLNFD